MKGAKGPIAPLNVSYMSWLLGVVKGAAISMPTALTGSYA